VTCVRAQKDFETQLEQYPFDLIISDFSLPGSNGFSALEAAKQKAPHCPFIFFSGTLGEETAIECLKQGATDYVLKDRPGRLGVVIQRAMRELAEAAKLSEAQQRIAEQAALLDKAQDAIWVALLNSQIQYWNHGAERLYGWTVSEVLGRSAKEFLYHDGDGFQLALEPLLENGEWAGEVTRKTKNHGEVVVYARWSLVRSTAGHPHSILAIDTDITERKKMESKFLRAQRMETIGALAGGIAHDLNNALSPIVMGVDVLRAEKIAERRELMLDLMTKSAARCTELVRQILSFARGIRDVPEALDLRHLITEIVGLIESTFPQTIQVRSCVAPGLHRISGNATQLHQVLLNLCVNARDAMPKGGILEITAANIDLVNFMSPWRPAPVSGSFVVVTVSDSGHGMSPEILSKAFNPFFTTKIASQGTGLGLSTVQSIVTSHNGFMEVVSEIGVGSRFTVYLPATAHMQARISPLSESSLPRGKGEQILVVDHEMAILEMSREILEAYQYRVLTANNGAQAMALFNQHHDIQAAIVDWQMPNMDGPTTVRALRRIDPSIRIIGVCDLERELPSENAEPTHINALLQEPYTTKDLLLTLRRALDDENTKHRSEPSKS
jgi:PAS domain S-box-containing protein